MVSHLSGTSDVVSDQWEYRVDMVAITNATILQNTLNDRGKDGWELVACPQVNSTPAVQAFIFKRMKDRTLDKPRLMAPGKSSEGRET